MRLDHKKFLREGGGEVLLPPHLPSLLKTLPARNASSTVLAIAETILRFSVAIAQGSHLFPSRTQKLSPAAPMILHGKLCGKVGRRRNFFTQAPFPQRKGAWLCVQKRKTVKRILTGCVGFMYNLRSLPKGAFRSQVSRWRRKRKRKKSLDRRELIR